MALRVAVVEDEKRLAGTLSEGLRGEGYKTSVFYDGESAYRGLSEDPADLVILDLMLPGKSGQEVCRQLRQNGSMTPILVLTARDTVEDKVQLFDAGADDFITKPFSFEEILARLRALCRRAQQAQHKYVLHDVVLDSVAHKVHRADKEIPLTFKEFELLRYLFEHKGNVKTREDIYEHLWGRSDADFGNVVDVHIRNLRKKIDDEYYPKIIRTVRGVGYALAQ